MRRAAWSWLCSAKLHAAAALAALFIPALIPSPLRKEPDDARVLHCGPSLRYRHSGQGEAPEFEPAQVFGTISGRVKGESLDFVSDRPFRGKVVYDSVGTAGGAGGRYGSRLGPEGGDPRLHPSGSGEEGASNAVTKAIEWLLHHQSPDGSWSAAEACEKEGEPEGDVASTGLAVLALIETGRGGSAGRAARWLLFSLDQAPDLEARAIGVLAIVRALPGLDLPVADSFLKPAVAELAASPKVGRWTPLAFRALRLAGRDAPRELEAGAAAPPASTDFEAWHFAAASELRRPTGASWPADLERALRERQHESGCRAGSWDPRDVRGASRGRAASTALNALTLELLERIRRTSVPASR